MILFHTRKALIHFTPNSTLVHRFSTASFSLKHFSTCKQKHQSEQIFCPFEIQFSDLLLLSSGQRPASREKLQRLGFISEKIIQNLGPTGPGLIAITGFPLARVLSQKLLPLARKLALHSNEDRKMILKEHNLGSDVPLKNLDRIVSSFAMQMKYGQEEFNFDVDAKADDDSEFKDLGFSFRGLGFCMMELGLCLARVCDKLIAGCELEQSLLQGGTAKGRLIHYHSVLDNVILGRKASKRKGSGNGGKDNLKKDLDLGDGSKSNLWQRWHYDYGIFTFLTGPMFLLSSGNDGRECESTSGHSYLQVFHPEMNRVLNVKVSKGSCIVQVGEAADVLSKGKLRATLHCVTRPAEVKNLSRENFVIFLQPAWTKTFSLSDYSRELLSSSTDFCAERVYNEEEANGLARNLHNIVPPLCKRLRDGMTFAEFSKETTKQYYGGQGLQSHR